MNLSTLPDLRAAEAPDAPAVADDNIDLNNTQFFTPCGEPARRLREHGVSAGDVVAIMLPNRVELRGGAVRRMAPRCRGHPDQPDAGARRGGLPDRGRRRARSSSSTRRLEIDAPVDMLVDDATWTAGQAAAVAEPAEHRDDALALLIYTSGTTGRPKGVMLDHANLNAMCRMVIDAFKMTSDDHSLLILPLFHVNGIVVGTLSPLVAGGRATIAGGSARRRSSAASRQCRADVLLGGSDHLHACCPTCPPTCAPTRPRSGSRSAARHRPASSCSTKFETRYGIPLIEGYGLSEGTCASTGNPLDGKRKPGTVGLPLPGQTIRIVGAGRRRLLPTGETGEVLIQGANVMRGYLNRPEETAKTLVDGWLHTGDVGRLDEDGYLRAGRPAKDMIIRGGENIYPKEIETVVYQLPRDRRGRRRRARPPGVRRRAGALCRR